MAVFGQISGCWPYFRCLSLVWDTAWHGWLHLEIPPCWCWSPGMSTLSGQGIHLHQIVDEAGPIRQCHMLFRAECVRPNVVRALADIVATKLGIILLSFFHALTFLPEGVCLQFWIFGEKNSKKIRFSTHKWGGLSIHLLFSQKGFAYDF